MPLALRSILPPPALSAVARAAQWRFDGLILRWLCAVSTLRTALIVNADDGTERTGKPVALGDDVPRNHEGA